ncbi:MAG: alpha/beta fold hydrolase [Bacteroidetes bacterium]|nr:alpha/beta fold hydrolase [Bacteroidota bacterium]
MNALQPQWLDKAEYPFESRFIDQNGCRQHYIDEGAGTTLLFVHGTPSWSFDFRNVIKKLSGSYRCIALDHMGFGLSEKSADYDYSLANHTANLTRLIHALNLKDIVLVLHDFGGPIGLEYALTHAENVKKIIILNSWIGSSENEPEYQKLKKNLQSPLLPFLYLKLNFSPRFLMPQSFGTKKLSRILRRQYTSPFGSGKDRYGMLAFAKSLLNDQAFFESQLKRIPVLETKPALLIWGASDKFAGEKYLHRFEKVFKQVQQFSLSNAGHFPQEEEPELITNAMLQFLES